jgi:hypothetical protein
MVAKTATQFPTNQELYLCVELIGEAICWRAEGDDLIRLPRQISQRVRQMKPVQPSGDHPSAAELLDVPELDFTTSAFADFSERLDVQLVQLVARWQHLAAPRALRVGRTCTSLRNLK